MGTVSSGPTARCSSLRLIRTDTGLPVFVVAEVRSIPFVGECGLLDKRGETKVYRWPFSGETPPSCGRRPKMRHRDRSR
jgi:hypothetical protein